ncbi:MAG: PadR family transcriptional regulator, partial [Methanoregula sp.]
VTQTCYPARTGQQNHYGIDMNIQFKKGVLEICVLFVLAKKDCYGYELVDEISKKIDIAEGTIYPLLHRLKDEGLVTTYLQESGEGPPRKYYRLTDKGWTREHEQREEWVHFAASVNALLEGEPQGDN